LGCLTGFAHIWGKGENRSGAECAGDNRSVSNKDLKWMAA
jgi:hypothetical protein